MASALLSTCQSAATSSFRRCCSHRSTPRAPRRIRARSSPITGGGGGGGGFGSSLAPSCRRLSLSNCRRPRESAAGVAAPSSSPAASPAEEQEGGGADAEEEAPGPSSSSASTSSSEPESFSWRDHWYPVSLVEDLDPAVPTPFQLLNRDIVLWKDPATAEWVAFDDRCPHRLAPLSEGRIDEDGWLQCSYHGWSFDGAGSCRKIPQAAPEGPEARAVKSPRACVAKLPTMVSQGLLFVWPDEKGWEKAAATKPPMLPDDFSSPNFSTVTIQRDLFYGYDTLMENVSDPSHIEFAHHKVTGRRDRARPLLFKMESSGAWGFSAADSGNPRITSNFVAPCYNMNKISILVYPNRTGPDKGVRVPRWASSSGTRTAPSGAVQLPEQLIDFCRLIGELCHHQDGPQPSSPRYLPDRAEAEAGSGRSRRFRRGDLRAVVAAIHSQIFHGEGRTTTTGAGAARRRRRGRWPRRAPRWR